MEIKFEFFNNYKNEKFKKVFSEYYNYLGITLRPDTTIFDQMTISANNGQTKTVVLQEDNKIVAFVMFQILNLTNDNQFFKHSVGHIQELYVVESKRHQKIATNLLKFVEEYIKNNNVSKLLLTARPNVYEFYINLGFELDDNYKCANNLQCLTKQIV